MDLVHTCALLLDKARLIQYDRRSGYMHTSPLAKIASHYYISYESMQRFNEILRPSLSEIDLLRVVCLAGEFQDISVKEEEKQELEQLSERAPIPIKESFDEPTAKVNLLLQAYISGVSLEGYSLACDLVFIHQNAGRIIRALFEIALAKNWAKLAIRCLDLANMCEHRQWSIQGFLRQLSNIEISSQVLRKMERNNLSVAQYFALEPQELGELSGGGITQGRQLHRIIHCFPKLDVSAHIQPITRSILRIDLSITPDFEFDEKFYNGSTVLPFGLF